jgi:hypothetical protein
MRSEQVQYFKDDCDIGNVKSVQISKEGEIKMCGEDLFSSG